MTDSSSWAFAGCMDVVRILLLLHRPLRPGPSVLLAEALTGSFLGLQCLPFSSHCVAWVFDHPGYDTARSESHKTSFDNLKPASQQACPKIGFESCMSSDSQAA